MANDQWEDVSNNQWEDVSNESIPQMLGRNAKLAYNESFGTIPSAINDLSFNNIKPNIERRFGKDVANNIFPEQKTLEGKSLRLGLGVLAPGGAAIKTLGAVKGGAIFGAASGGFNDILNPDINMVKRLINTATGGALGAGVGKLLPIAASQINKGLNFIKEIPEAMDQIKKGFKDIKDPAKLALEVRESLFNSRKAVGETLGKELDNLANSNPDKKIDHSSDFERLKSAINDNENNPGLSTQIKSILKRVRNPDAAAMLNKFINDPSKAESVSLADSQKLKVAIQNAPDIAMKLKKGKFADYSPADLELLDLLDNVKLSQSNVFPELSEIRKPYAEYMKNYDEVKTMFKPKQLLDKIRSGFGNEEVEKIINTVLPEKTIKRISGFKSAEKSISIGKKAAGAGAALLVGKKAIDYGASISNKRE